MLRMIIPETNVGAVEQIVFFTRLIAAILCPVATIAFLLQLRGQSRDMNAWVPIATAGIAAVTPILISFTAYFCLWHSLLGLSRLRSQEGLTSSRFVVSVLPLSMMAVSGVVAAGWFFRQTLGTISIGTVPASVQTLFIGLSAIAVPHLLLHEWADRAERSSCRPEVLS